MIAIEIYTRPGCGYCAAAKSLLMRKKAAFTELSVATDPAFREQMYDRAGAGTTFPQIFIGATHVGGCDELYALDRAGKLDAMLAALDPTERAPDAAVTVREGRYVIPVRSTARARVGGIVHDESATRATVFIEPPEVIELGNALRAAEVEEQREVLQVLRDLTELLRPHRDAIAAAWEMCIAFDDLCARARYAVEVNGFAPSIGGGPLEIRLDDVRFGYTRSDPVLNGLSLHARAGETLALVGTAGSGKSTISLLLPRFYDVHSGSAQIGGLDVRDVKLQELRRAIGVVFEEAFLFSSSIRDNIAYGRHSATDAEVEDAARRANLGNKIQSWNRDVRPN